MDLKVICLTNFSNEYYAKNSPWKVNYGRNQYQKAIEGVEVGIYLPGRLVLVEFNLLISIFSVIICLFFFFSFLSLSMACLILVGIDLGMR